MPIHVANGEWIAKLLKQSTSESVVAWNEAMCEGSVSLPLFDEKFCTLRANSLQVSLLHYQETMRPCLQALQSMHDELHLYFDTDMFCAVNVVTLLAYLEQTQHTAPIFYHVLPLDGTIHVTQTCPIHLGNFANIFKTVRMRYQYATSGYSFIDNGLALFPLYKKPMNPLQVFISQHLQEERTALCKLMIETFPQYGIGDCILYRMIDAMQNSKAVPYNSAPHNPA